MYLELRHLRTIRAIHQAGGVQRAADVLNITQSALSHQLKGLEDQCGVELFVRKAKPLRLSAAGMRLLRLADEVLDLVLEDISEPALQQALLRAMQDIVSADGVETLAEVEVLGRALEKWGMKTSPGKLN